MKKRNKLLSLLLCAALLIGLVPFTAQEAQAEVGEPSTTQFADVGKLKGFNTNDNDGAINPAKVYFGANNQQWWIAGVESGNLVLFAASPLTDARFNASGSGGTFDGYNVNPNHYGASPLRNNTLKGLETSYFTPAEQKLMNNTSVSTQNFAGTGDPEYSTTDKLYLADRGTDLFYIRVGTNNNLRIDKTYWGSNIFWLRAPDVSIDSNALVALPYTSLSSHDVGRSDSVVPAFNFKLSSVIFASAAPAATKDGQLKTEDVTGNGAFTLRHKSTDVGDAKTGKGNVCVSISNVSTNPDVKTYLVAQNSDGAWAKKVSNGDIIFADELSSSLTSFDKCKVWLETTNSTTRITSAKMAEATTQSSHNVKVKLGDHMSITNGNGRQTGVNGSISEITVTADSGYYFPTDYDVSTVNGISVSKLSDTTFEIYGIPDADTIISLPAAKAHEHSWTYELKSGSTDTIEATCNGAGPCTLSNQSGGSVTIHLPQGVTQGKVTYDGNEKTATLTGGFTTGLGLPANADIGITYAKKNQSGGYEEISGEPKDAGDYRASITLGSGVNAKTAYVDFAISPRPITITVENKSKTYGEPDPAFTGGITSGSLVSSDDLGPISYYRTKTDTDKDANIYEKVLDARYTANSNYDVTVVKGNFTIDKKEIGITWSTEPLIYNGTLQAPAATATGVVNNDKIGLTVEGTETDAGNNYQAEVTEITGDKAANYKLPSDESKKTTTFSIEKKAVAKPAIDSKVYTGADLKSDIGDSAFYTVEKNESGTDAGKYDVTLKLKDSNNYKWEGSETSDTVTLEFQIKAAALTGVSVKQTGTLTYNGKEQTAKVDPKATPVNNQPVTFTYSKEQGSTYTEDVPAFTEVGEHTVYYKATAPNHEVYTGSFKVTIAANTSGGSGGDPSQEDTDGGGDSQNRGDNNSGDSSNGENSESRSGNSSGEKGGSRNAEVQTGDENSPALWIALMLIALVVGGTVSCGRRKRAR